jgi:hypothetical protein
MRPQNLASVVQSIQESTEDYSVVIMAAGESAGAARSLPVALIEDNGGTWPQRINVGYRATTEPYIFTGADDLYFLPGWLDAAMIAMNQIGDGVVGVNDGMNMAGVHFLVSRAYVETFGSVLDDTGTVASEAYVHSYCDDELRETAKFHGKWAFCMNSVVEHRHCGNGKAPHDATYAAGEASMATGYATFASRAHLWATA